MTATKSSTVSALNFPMCTIHSRGKVHFGSVIRFVNMLFLAFGGTAVSIGKSPVHMLGWFIFSISTAEVQHASAIFFLNSITFIPFCNQAHYTYIFHNIIQLCLHLARSYSLGLVLRGTFFFTFKGSGSCVSYTCLYPLLIKQLLPQNTFKLYSLIILQTLFNSVSLTKFVLFKRSTLNRLYKGREKTF